MSVVPGASAELYCSVYLSTNQVSSAAMEEHAARMDKDALERLSVLTILHATCQTALERLAGGRDADREIAADLTRILEHTKH